MNKPYHAFENLRQHKARLHGSVQLGSGIQLAAWSNDGDCVTQNSDHHTLSLYVDGGQDTWHKTPAGWRNGGAPDRFCLMPEQSETTWDVRSKLSFVHLYCTDAHLRHLAEQIWDRSPATITLDEKIFSSDNHIAQIYRQFLLNCDWQQSASHLTLSSATTLLMTHLIQHYSEVLWKLPAVRGGLAPTVLRNSMAWIEDQLDQPLTLAELALQAGLSEFHFARMFKQSTRLAPHQYVMQRRMAKAEQLVRNTQLPLTEIALACGFNSASHFSNRFKTVFGYAPSLLRR
ncbi:AraC family transcriptional regulator [Erwiniaceae bacterium BAC15a-03b]|uniref:AraC family transcriptional regulator n=1 Tax=Winslowiella arboricola TaxID=2978220 RepID=A0A9J6PSY7_9GAMM|nr:helix-turn-helix domain-containing protein [Winslowiella arboricola]MCU5772847.1 AraC family transcriptional regulator [Winslowiella arboricola]MCU5777151.1 AraC family transcriptional regulator [Winslowiella arboricola]